MADSEVFVEETHEIVEVKKKGRKPMSEERKEQLRTQLKKAREAKKAKKAKGEKIEPEPKVKKVLEATEEEPAVYVKNVRKTKPAVDHREELDELKAQIAELKANKTSKADLEEIKALKAEMKEIRAAAVEYKKQQLQKTKDAKEAQKEAEAKQETIITTKKAKNEPQKPVLEPPPFKPEARYSTYKKSVWSKFI